MWWRAVLSMAFMVLQDVVKNPDAKAQMKTVCCQIRDLLIMAYPPEAQP